MRQIRDMSIVVIDITNSCHKSCSNCTRFCGHHKKTYFMDFEIFKQAIDSMDGYGGATALIGGEPLLHPEANKFLEYMQGAMNRKGIKELPKNSRSKAIVKDYFAFTRTKRWFELAYNKGKTYAIYTSIPKNYYKSYENLQETISNIWLNDHKNPSFHQPILVSRKDIGIGDAEFAELRDKCWLHNCWSASITPKGTFFCEIAGTMDILFNGPGGHPIESGWWNKDLSEWQDQFHWCDLCGMPLKTFSRNANDETDDASPALYEKLKEMETPKFKQGKVELFSLGNAEKKDGKNFSSDMNLLKGRYLQNDGDRFSDATEHIKPNSIVDVSELENAKLRDWLFVKEPNAHIPENFIETIKTFYLNPGYLFIGNFGEQKFALLSLLAASLKNIEITEIKNKNINELKTLYGEKVCILEPDFENIPDIDIPALRDLVFEDYNKDSEFKNALQKITEKRLQILLPNVASPFHTYSIAKLLKNLGHSIQILLSAKFEEFFIDSEFKDNLTIFENDFYDYKLLQSLIAKLKNEIKFDGFIIPYALCAIQVKPTDNYTNVLKTAYDIAGKSLGIINIKREFIEPDYVAAEEV